MVSKEENIPNLNLQLNNEKVKQVNKFNYLGSTITTDGRSLDEIKKRIAIAKSSFQKMRTILTNLKINLKVRLKVLKTYVWSTLTYGCETWTLNKEARERLEATEMWMIRRMMRVPWIARRTNESVLQQAGTNRELLKIIKKRQLKFLGHAIRKHKIEHLSITGAIEGRRARGRQRHTYVDRIIASNNLNCKPNQLIQQAEDRTWWRHTTAQVT